MLAVQLLCITAALVSQITARLSFDQHGQHHHVVRGSALLMRDVDTSLEGNGVFPPKCTEQCKSYLGIRKKCGAPPDASPLEEGNDKLACTCNDAYFDAVVSCVGCAPDPFRVAIGDSPKEWVESSLDICMDTGKEMECVDTSALSDDAGDQGDGTRPVDDDDEDEDDQTEGGAGESDGESSTPAFSNSDEASKIGTLSSPSGEPSSAMPTSMTSSASVNSTGTAEDGASSTDSLSASASAADGIGFDDEDMFGSSASSTAKVQHLMGLTVIATSFLGMLCV